MKFPFHTRGLSVIEIIVAAAIIVTLVTGAAGAWQLNLRLSNSGIQQSQAAIIVEETAEILQLLRDDSWSRHISPLSLNTTYQLAWSNNKYSITQAQTLIQNSYVRTITLASVNRDSNDNITASGGTLDVNTKKVTVSVFLVGATSTPLMTSEMLLHNMYAN
jgi:hypothetical protein